MSLEAEIKEIVRESVYEILSDGGLILNDFEAITPEVAAEIIGCGKQTIFDLINDRERSKFPGAKVSPKVFVIDRAGLTKWLRNGGLVGVQTESKTVEPTLKAVK